MLVFIDSFVCWAVSDRILVTSVVSRIFQFDFQVRVRVRASIQVKLTLLWFDVDRGPPRDVAEVKQVLLAPENCWVVRTIPRLAPKTIFRHPSHSVVGLLSWWFWLPRPGMLFFSLRGTCSKHSHCFVLPLIWKQRVSVAPKLERT